MINKVLLFVAKFAVGKHLVGAVAASNNALKGRRSEILLGIAAIIQALKYAGIVDAAIADAVSAPLLGAVGPTLAEKFSSVKSTLDSVIPQVPESKP